MNYHWERRANSKGLFVGCISGSERDKVSIKKFNFDHWFLQVQPEPDQKHRISVGCRRTQQIVCQLQVVKFFRNANKIINAFIPLFRNLASNCSSMQIPSHFWIVELYPNLSTDQCLELYPVFGSCIQRAENHIAASY